MPFKVSSISSPISYNLMLKRALRYQCSELDCEASFAKHHLLREHICTKHAPPGTKPYRCEHEGCTKSFTTSQKLRVHAKTHDGTSDQCQMSFDRLAEIMSPDKRYTCVHPACTTPGQSTPTYYSTWTSLQQHMRTAHPPTCPHPSCNGKIFSAQKGLRAHLRIHEHRDIEAGLREDDTDVGGDNDDEPPPKKRRGGEVGRDFICEYEGCGKDFKSVRSLPRSYHVSLRSRNRNRKKR